MKVHTLHYGPRLIVLQGDFANDKFQGRGLLLADDDTCFDGEFAGDCWLHGKGTLTLANGDCIEGHFSGNWYERSGLKISGATYKRGATEAPRNAHTAPPFWMESTDSRGDLAEQTDHLRSPRVLPSHKWVPLFERCKQQVIATLV